MLSGEDVVLQTIFVSWQLLEKSREQIRDLFVAFVDLNKAFDTIYSDAMESCPLKFIS